MAKFNKNWIKSISKTYLRLNESAELTADVTQPQQMTQTYGGLGQSAFDTRTFQAPGASNNYRDNPTYSGYSISNTPKGVIVPTNYVNMGGILFAPYMLNNPMGQFQWNAQSVAALILLNTMHNPAFDMTQFQNIYSPIGESNSFVQAFIQALNNASSPPFGQSADLPKSVVDQITSIMMQNNFISWLQTGYNQIMQSGNWNANKGWKF